MGSFNFWFYLFGLLVYLFIAVKMFRYFDKINRADTFGGGMYYVPVTILIAALWPIAYLFSFGMHAYERLSE